MLTNLAARLESSPILASAPCRLDMGGTLDISTFYLPLRHLSPCTFNAALGMRTRVTLFPWKKDRVKISSRGFESAEYALDQVPFKHPLGLMFAIAAYFRTGGVHIAIESASPPRSALGGSSAAAIALVAAFAQCLASEGQEALTTHEIATLAFAIEGSVAGVPCGFQDHLAATFGGLNTWYWPTAINAEGYDRRSVFSGSETDLEKHLLLAYCGVPHESKDINGRWVQQFLQGRFRTEWCDIVRCCQAFVKALIQRNFREAARMMNQEVRIRKQMTPDVLDDIGDALVQAAGRNHCGARFTGAGGGGCIWGLGEQGDMAQLRGEWERILARRQEARLLDVKIDTTGVRLENDEMR